LVGGLKKKKTPLKKNFFKKKILFFFKKKIKRYFLCLLCGVGLSADSEQDQTDPRRALGYLSRPIVAAWPAAALVHLERLVPFRLALFFTKVAATSWWKPW